MEGKKKAGRPRKKEEEKLTKRVEIRFTEEEYNYFLGSVPKKSRRDFVKSLFKKNSKKVPLSSFDLETIVEIKKIGTNINQIAKRINTDFLKNNQKVIITDEILDLLEKYKKKLEEIFYKTL